MAEKNVPLRLWLRVGKGQALPQQRIVADVKSAFFGNGDAGNGGVGMEPDGICIELPCCGA